MIGWTSMEVKEVYSIRITKKDEDIESYLEQFPPKKQNAALKKLLKYGIEKLHQNYDMDTAIKGLEETILAIQSQQDKKIDRVLQLLSRSEINPSNESENILDEEPEVDLNKARSSLQESLSMFG